MEGIRVIYVGMANRYRATGTGGTVYVFQRGVAQIIPYDDVGPVTRDRPADWQVERPIPTKAETTPTRPPHSRRQATRQDINATGSARHTPVRE